MIVRVDALGIWTGEAPSPGGAPDLRLLVAEVVGGFYGQAALGRWWLPCRTLGDGEAPAEVAVRALKEQLGLDLEAPVIVGARPQRLGESWHLGLVVAGALSGAPSETTAPPVTGFSLRVMAGLPDQIGPWHRDDLAVLAERYRRLAAATD